MLNAPLCLMTSAISQAIITLFLVASMLNAPLCLVTSTVSQAIIALLVRFRAFFWHGGPPHVSGCGVSPSS
jgi:hypothetical protein